jgi:hypothetical protein
MVAPSTETDASPPITGRRIVGIRTFAVMTIPFRETIPDQLSQHYLPNATSCRYFCSGG